MSSPPKKQFQNTVKLGDDKTETIFSFLGGQILQLLLFLRRILWIRFSWEISKIDGINAL